MRFFRRPYPSANSILLEGPRPVLVDPGDDGAFGALQAWLGGVRPALVVNTHWHNDHAGANHRFPDVPIAVPAGEMGVVRAWAPDPGRAVWLAQTLTRYTAARGLAPGDVVETGTERWAVVALPGHTRDQVGLFDAASRTLIAGDALLLRDLGWLDVDEDPAAAASAAATLDRIEALAPSTILPGHGPAITDAAASLELARRRLAGWAGRPDRVAWHAGKRILTHALIQAGGMGEAELERYARAAPWMAAIAGRVFGTDAVGFLPGLVAELERSGAAVRRDGRLTASVTV